MKKLFNLILFMCILSIHTYSQVEIKEIELGTKMSFEGKVMSLIGEQYYFDVGRLNNGTIYFIFAVPSDGDYVRRVYKSEVSKLINAVENKYGVNLKFIKDNDYSEEEGVYFAMKDGVEYMISIKDHNEFKDPEYDIALYIVNTSLKNIATKEEQQKANDDI